MNTRLQPALYSADLAGCTDVVGRAPREIIAAFCSALQRAGATVVQEVFHWPETGAINIDIFSCSSTLRSLEAIDDLRQSFGAQHVTVQEIPRADGHGPRTGQRH